MQISELIKSARIGAKLTQKQLADLLGIPQPRIAEWEKGKYKPSAETYLLILEKTKPCQ